MASINVDLDYFEHWKAIAMVKALGPGADGLPIKLWAYTAKYHAETGAITGPAAEILEERLRWCGDPGKAIEALLKVRFLEKIDNGYLVHDWTEYQGHVVAYKLRGKKARASQLDKVLSRPEAGNKPATSQPEAGNKPAKVPHEAGPMNSITNITNKAGHNYESGQPELSSSYLAERFKHTQSPACDCSKCHVDFAKAWFDEMISIGISPVSILDEIVRADRLKAEHLFRLTDRFEKMAAKRVQIDEKAEKQRIESIAKAAQLRREKDLEEKLTASKLSMAELKKVYDQKGASKNGNKT